MRTIRCSFVIVLTGAGLWLGTSVSCFAVPSHSLVLPAYSTNFDDLDLRDSQNRRITSAAQQQTAKVLFETSLYGLLVENLTPGKRIVLGVIAQTWKTTFGWLGRVSDRFAERFLAVVVKNSVIHLSVRSRPISLKGAAGFVDLPLKADFHALIPVLLASVTLLR